MKPRFWTSLLIFASAYAPLALIVTVKDFDFGTRGFAHQTGCIIAIGLALISVLALVVVMRAIPGQHPVTVKSVKGRASDLINYSIPYLVTFVTVDKFFELPNLLAFMVFMALLFVLTWKTQSLFINPVLAIMGYGLYDVQFQEGPHDRDGVLLGKGAFRAEQVVRVTKLSQFLYLGIAEKSNEGTDQKDERPNHERK
jgi:hypothetical protein